VKTAVSVLTFNVKQGDNISDDERNGNGRARNSAKGSRYGRSRSGASAGEVHEAAQHPARLLDRDDARHYSGFLGQMSGEDLPMDVPDLLASLLELGGAIPNSTAQAVKPGTPGPSQPLRGPQKLQHGSSHWESSSSGGPSHRRSSRDGHGHGRPPREQGGAPAARPSHGAGQQWDQWETPTQLTGHRRPTDTALPLHEAWMQHEAEWAQLHGLRHPVHQVRSPQPFSHCSGWPLGYCT
jgi:hypothetical protein